MRVSAQAPFSHLKNIFLSSLPPGVKQRSGMRAQVTGTGCSWETGGEEPNAGEKDWWAGRIEKLGFDAERERERERGREGEREREREREREEGRERERERRGERERGRGRGGERERQ